MKKKTFYCILCSVYCSLFTVHSSLLYADKYDKLIKQYKKEITEKSQDLKDLEEQIKNKQVEKERYKVEEKNIRRQLNTAEVQLRKINSEITNIQKQIRNTKKVLDEAKHNFDSANMAIGQLKKIISKEFYYLYCKHYANCVLTSDPWTEKLRTYAINNKINLMSLAKLRKEEAESAQEKYLKIKSELDNLYSDLDLKKNEQKVIYSQKRNLLKTTQGKRIAVEEEIDQLNQTAQEMQSFIYQVEQKKKQTLELKQQQELAKKQFNEKKHNLSWPVDGNVILSFGKNKHSELDTYIISNGIKIKTTSDADVHSIDKGIVVYAKNFRSYGRTIIIDHGGNNYTIYGNLGEILSDENKNVFSGEVIGKTSSDGILYFEVRVENKPENPLQWLK